MVLRHTDLSQILKFCSSRPFHRYLNGISTVNGRKVIIANLILYGGQTFFVRL